MCSPRPAAWGARTIHAWNRGPGCRTGKGGAEGGGRAVSHLPRCPPRLVSTAVRSNAGVLLASSSLVCPEFSGTVSPRVGSPELGRQGTRPPSRVGTEGHPGGSRSAKQGRPGLLVTCPVPRPPPAQHRRDARLRTAQSGWRGGWPCPAECGRHLPSSRAASVCVCACVCGCMYAHVRMCLCTCVLCMASEEQGTRRWGKPRSLAVPRRLAGRPAAGGGDRPPLPSPLSSEAPHRGRAPTREPPPPDPTFGSGQLI